MIMDIQPERSIMIIPYYAAPPPTPCTLGNCKTHGVVMMTSASTSSLSNLEFSPSLSEVVTKV